MPKGKSSHSLRRDSKHRVLLRGESVRPDGRYQFKYQVNGKSKYIYSWKLEPTDKTPVGKVPGPSLRELKKEMGYDFNTLDNPSLKDMTVCALVSKYVKTKVGVKPTTKVGFAAVEKKLANMPFGQKTIDSIRTSDAKLFLIGLQNEGMSCGTVNKIRSVLRPAFQMAVDDDILRKNPFSFQITGVLVNDKVPRVALTKDQMIKFLKFVHDDNTYCKYYEAFYILFHTGMRIGEFCGLTISDIDLERKVVTIDHQLQRLPDGSYIVEKTKTKAGTRRLPISDDVAYCFSAIIEDRKKPKVEKIIDGYSGFLYLDTDGMPEAPMHWQGRFNHAVAKYNETFKIKMPPISPHVCRHTYCSNMAKAGMNPKTLQYLMGHSDIGVTMNTYTHLGLEDAKEEMHRLQDQLANARQEQEKMEMPITQAMFRKI